MKEDHTMKFTCEKHVLQAAMAIAARACSPKNPIAALEGVLVEAYNNVKLTGYDLKKGIYTDFDADIPETGSIVLGARLFGDIIRSMPDGIVTVETKDGETTRISCGGSEFSIIGTPAENYPELPDVDSRSTISLPGGTLKTMIGQTLFAVSDNESRPVYTGALFEIENNELTIVAVDGYRLALRREALDGNDAVNCSFIVPGSALSELEKICGESDEPVRITLGSKHISFKTGRTVLVSRRLEGEFLNYRKTVPSVFPIEVEVQRTAFAGVVSRVSLIISDQTKTPIRCYFNDDEIRFFCQTGLGRAEDYCEAVGSGNGLEIGFNNRYLLDAFRAAPADKLKVCLNTNSSPCVLLPVDGSNKFLYMILPVRLKADN